MYLWLFLALLFAFLEAVAVSKNMQRLEYIAKPAVMICLFLWLYTSTGLQGKIFWFGLGILLSLVGDVMLLVPQDRMFLGGLVAFLLAHVFYLIGFKDELLKLTGWSFILLLILMLSAIHLLSRIVHALRSRGQNGLVTPVIVYGLVISVMLYAALSTIFNPAWETSAAFLVGAGAFLFWISDLILAWNKFISLIKNGRIPGILAYQLGQIGLIAGVISQFR